MLLDFYLLKRAVNELSFELTHHPDRARVPLQGHFANQDDWCTPAAVDELETALSRAGVPHEIHRYDAAHAFANERSLAYHVDSANEAWRRMLEFLQRQV